MEADSTIKATPRLLSRGFVLVLISLPRPIATTIFAADSSFFMFGLTRRLAICHAHDVTVTLLVILEGVKGLGICAKECIFDRDHRAQSD